MIHLAVRSEFSFKKAFAPINEIIKLDGDAIGIADDNNTYGHIPFVKAMEKVGKKAILGVRLTVVEHLKERFEYKGKAVILLARNNDGLKEIYKLTSLAWEQFYYIPRISVNDFNKISDNIIKINGNDTSDLEFDYTAINFNTPDKIKSSESVYIDDNRFLKQSDRDVYELMAGSSKRGDGRSYSFETDCDPLHVLSEEEVTAYFGYASMLNTHLVAEECNANLEKADMVKYTGRDNIVSMCIKSSKIDLLNDKKYNDRYNYEIDLIKSKGYEDYFMIVSDMIKYAKRQGILVGPSRGSSAGSLVCYLLDITEIDPLEHDLIFERFIDINRFDLPDIDIDFPDTKRDIVIKYLINKYGESNVASLANINRFKAKYAIGEFAMALNIPPFETTELKDSIIERSGGDARAAQCISDTLEGTDVGKTFIEKYPAMSLVSEIENHASHAGKHAAGIIVSNKPLTDYSGVNVREGVIMMDKKDAEYIDLLKIDVLGLRTLSILEDVCNMIHMPVSDVYKIPLDDFKTFRLFNSMRLNGIFQFEGQALRIITKQMGVHVFDDIVAITALARPGALNSGGTGRYIKYKTGKEQPIYRSEAHRKITGSTMGIVVYQEQMMSMAKEIGGMSWEDVSNLRKAASKSLGDEFFSKFKEKFIAGALENKVSQSDAELLWHDIAATGSWTFNKSHAVSYGLVSYWTAWFKANYPLEFAVANLNNARSVDSAIRLLRDFVENEGFEYIAVDPDESDVNWTVSNGKLLGGLTNIKGLGVSKAKKIISDRNIGKAPTKAVMNKLVDPITDFDILFPCKEKWGNLYSDPVSYGLDKKPAFIKDIEGKGEYILIGKIITRDLRDRNDYQAVTKRGSKVDKDQFYLKLIVEDDTDSILCMVGHTDYETLGGKQLAEELKEGTWVIIRGNIKSDWRMITIKHIVNLDVWR
jgi:DNA-directed DNA polymerase III PolC